MAGKFEKTVFMLGKLRKDIFRDRQIYELSEDLHSPELREYYFIMTEQQMLAGHSQQYHFDDQGTHLGTIGECAESPGQLESPADVARRRGRRKGDIQQHEHGPKAERPAAEPDEAPAEASAS